jgi:RNA polymerase sigma-70 factor (ECF subfamily)
VRDQNDVELVRAFNKGDIQAFEEFMRRHQDKIFRLSSLNLYQSSDAVDVTQEVFLRAYKGLKKFHFGAEPLTWLYRVTKNVCKEFNRKTTSIKNVSKLMEVNNVNTAYDKAEDELLKRENIAVIKELLSDLSQRQKDVVMFRIFEEFSVKETANILGCKEGTVKATLNKAMKNVREKHKLIDDEL